MKNIEDRIKSCLEEIQERIPFRPKVAVVLGSGLGAFADELEEEAVIPYAEMEGFPVPTVEGHQGRFLFSHVKDVPVVAMQGRVHYYEGYSMEDVVLPVRLMRKMGAEILLLTNAAGGLHADWNPGTLMLLTDQIASLVPSPLIGPNPESLGTRFPDMTEIYDRNLSAVIRKSAEELGIDLKEGVYVQLSGPNYESPAEVRMCRMLGGDAVGMSTACEAVAAKHCGYRICGISCITNPASGLSDHPLSHEEVQKNAAKAERDFRNLLMLCIPRLQ